MLQLLILYCIRDIRKFTLGLGLFAYLLAFNLTVKAQDAGNPEATLPPTTTTTTTSSTTTTTVTTTTAVCVYKMTATTLETPGLQTTMTPAVLMATGSTLSCLVAKVNQALQVCAPWLNYQSYVGAWTRGYMYDDCVVYSYFFGVNYTTTSYGYRSNLTPAVCYTTINTMNGTSCTSGDFYFDSNCNSLPAPPLGSMVCHAAALSWKATPISLLWDGSKELDTAVTFVDFPLDPGKPGKSYKWRASEKAPLLVFDPEHLGRISSASQLFGEWTFGGQKSASLTTATTDLSLETSPRPWKDGYQALGSLDRNADGEISGVELEPLALWFDKNRDGVSDLGEVKRLDSVGVTTLYFNPDRVEEHTGDIYAEIGYRREVNGQITTGVSVDWHGEVGNSKAELINMEIAKTRLCKTGVENSFAEKNNNNEINIADSNFAKTSSVNTETAITGVWVWTTKNLNEDLKGDLVPQGVLTFKETEDGTVAGHSLVETPFDPTVKPLDIALSKIQSRLSIFHLDGKKTISRSKQVKVSFKITSFDGSVIETNAYLLDKGQKLKGKSTAKVNFMGKEQTFTYNWSAYRLEPK